MDQFESPPDDVLLEEILPTLPFDDLMNFCATSRRIHELCQLDNVWFRRLRHEYPDRVADKPKDQTWHDYYLSIARPRLIPIWMNRQIIDSENFHPTNPLPSYHLRRQYVPYYHNLLILYTNVGLTPIYGIVYRNGHPIQAKRYRDSLDQVARVILSDNPNTIQTFLEQSRRLTIPRLGDRFIRPLIRDGQL